METKEAIEKEIEAILGDRNLMMASIKKGREVEAYFDSEIEKLLLKTFEKFNLFNSERVFYAAIKAGVSTSLMKCVGAFLSMDGTPNQIRSTTRKFADDLHMAVEFYTQAKAKAEKSES